MNALGKSMKSRILLLLSIISLATLAIAEDPGSAYVKNSGGAQMHVWINGVYQGYLMPGETRYTVSDGFITNDSDRPTNDGKRTAVRESHGGWENNSKEKITVSYSFGAIRKTEDVAVNERGEAIFGATDRGGVTAELPSETDRENASQILKGSPPYLSNSANSEKKPDESKQAIKKTDESKENAPAILRGSKANLKDSAGSQKVNLSNEPIVGGVFLSNGAGSWVFKADGSAEYKDGTPLGTWSMVTGSNRTYLLQTARGRNFRLTLSDDDYHLKVVDLGFNDEGYEMWRNQRY